MASSNTLAGTAVVFGLDGRTVAFSGRATTTNEPTSLGFDDAFATPELTGKNNRVLAIAGTKRRYTIRVEILWKDVASGTPTRATADAVAALPAKLAKVTIGGFNNSLIDGDWNYLGGSLQDAADGFRKCTMTVAQFEADDGSMGALTTLA